MSALNGKSVFIKVWYGKLKYEVLKHINEIYWLFIVMFWESLANHILIKLKKECIAP